MWGGDGGSELWLVLGWGGYRYVAAWHSLSASPTIEAANGGEKARPSPFLPISGTAAQRGQSLQSVF